MSDDWSDADKMAAHVREVLGPNVCATPMGCGCLCIREKGHSPVHELCQSHGKSRSCPGQTIIQLGGGFDEIQKARHYNVHPSGVECIDIIRWMTLDGGNAFKYVFRAGEKGPAAKDYEKSAYYLRDTLNHGLPLWLPGPTLPARLPLELVLQHEPDPHRLEFYSAVGYGSISGALEAVQALIARG